jgi:DDE family transposase
MRSAQHSIVSASQVHQWALQWLGDSQLLKDHGPLCTATVVWSVLLRAAARLISVFAACRDLSEAPSQHAVFDALLDGLPRTLKVLEKRLNLALLGAPIGRGLRRHAWQVAIDWHLVPYYGEPHKRKNELYTSKPKQGTTRFHAYATACIVQYGERYTLALTWVRRGESTVAVLRRLLARLRELGVRIRCLLLDRAFYGLPVIAWLQAERLPFLMPVMYRGRKPKKRRARSGLHAIKRQKAGWYKHTLRRGEQSATIGVCVSYRSYRHHKTKKRRSQKLLFAAWRLRGTPTEIRERYRRRFGIESSYRQLRQARIVTCTRDPHLRLVFIAVALTLRNLWVWIHATLLAGGHGDAKTLRLARLRFKQLLDWIAQTVVAILHDGSEPCVKPDG